MSSKYEQSAIAEADAYEKERKRQAQVAIDKITSDAAAETQAAVDETATDIRAEQRSLLDTVDAAAVERQVTLGQAKEALARLGLSGSGAEVAGQHAAAVTEARRTHTARRTRDEAVASLTEALARREQEIARKRDADVLTETQAAEADAAKQRTALMEAAYSAESRETAAKIQAAQSAANKAQSEAKTQANRDESIRQDSLKRMLKEQQIHLDVYMDAMKEGWSIEETRRRQIEWTAWRRLSDTFLKTYRELGYDVMISAMAKHEMTERQFEDICFELQMDPDMIKASLAEAKKER